MNGSLEALRAGVAALLRADGASRAADIVRRSDIEIATSTEVWTIGSRQVEAQRMSLVVDADDYVATKANDGLVEKQVRAAFERAVRSSATELAELFVLLGLPSGDEADPLPTLTWERAYRQAPRHTVRERPPAALLLDAARKLLVAMGQTHVAEIAGRAELDVASLPSTAGSLLRVVLRLDPVDLVHVRTTETIATALKEAVRDAATSATDAVSSVEFAAMASEPAMVDTSLEAKLRRCLEAENLFVATASRGGDLVLVVVDGERVALATIVRGDRSMSHTIRPMPHVTIGRRALAGDDEVQELAAALAAFVTGEG